MRGASRVARLVVSLCLFLFVMGCGGDNNWIIPQWGVGVVNFNQGWIGIIDPSTQKVTTPFLVNELGSSGGGLFDVVITPDRSTALISNFGDSTVYFVDIRNPAAPAVLGSLTLTFFAEDIALTPNGKYALVTDGGASPRIAVLDVANRTLVEEYVSPDIDPDPLVEAYDTYFCSVAVGADGQTVLAADYSSAALHVLTIDAAGHLTFVNSIDVSNGQTTGLAPFFRPVNVSISPDGKTAILAGPANGDAAAVPPTVAADNMVFPVLQITAPGVVTLNGFVAPNKRINASQSIVFSPYGNKAYALCVQEGATNAVLVLDVTAPGTVASPGTAIVVNNVGTSQLFGVDTLAIDPYGHYLYVSNQTISGALNQLQVLDVTNNTMAKVITFDQVENPPGGGAPALMDALPAGVFIR